MKVGGMSGNPIQGPIQTAPQKIGSGFPGQIVPQKVGGPGQSPIFRDADVSTGAIKVATMRDTALLNTNDFSKNAYFRSPIGEVSMSGNAKITTRFFGEEPQEFTIGYGPASVTLEDGTQISWDTSPGDQLMNDLQIVRPNGLAQSVQLQDGVDDKNLPTGLSTKQLKEFVEILRAHEADPHTQWGT